MFTDRFYKLRKDELDRVFSKHNLSSIWRKIVMEQLRSSDITDIFDHYDFLYNIDDISAILRNDLLNGNYQCSLPLIYRLEKKLGICRHLIIPQPIDALILQVITEELYSEIISKQPSQNSFYSRDRHSAKKPHEIGEYGLSWRELWKKMQKKIYSFREEKELLVVTDLSNFYDSIDITELRKRVTSYVDDKEVLIDILFKIVEKISWLPDYLPYTGRGLPTTNIEGIRLLAHCFLFELDAILKEKSNDSYTRWMDDIVIGVNTRDEAIKTLSTSSDILKSRGLALNIAKTDIYSSELAEFHFLINENQYLDGLAYPTITSAKKNLEKELLKRFKIHLKTNEKAKHSEKVTKRYITAFGKLNSNGFLPLVPHLYAEHPGVRPNIIFYLSKLGYKKTTIKAVLSILENLRVYDDITLFPLCKLITDWNVRSDAEGDQFLSAFTKKITSFSIKRQSPFDFYCLLWIKTKYDHPDDLYYFIFKYESIWKSQPFLRRQVTAIIARLLLYKEDKLKIFLDKQISTGETQIISVANHILKFSSLTSLESKITMYLFPKKQPKAYPLNKYLVLCSILNSPKLRTNPDLKLKILNYIPDHYYRKWIEFQYNIK